MNIFRQKRFLSVALGHLMIDIMNGQRVVLLPFISVLMGLSNTTLGFLGSVYVISAALMQPIFGWMSDRFGPKWLVAGGVLWMAGFLSLALILPGWVGIGFLIVASLGSGMFHPAGAAQATLEGLRNGSGKETVTASYFFLAGQTGYFLGPLLGGFLLNRWGLRGILLVSLIAIPIGILSAISLNGSRLVKSQADGASKGQSNALRVGWLQIAALVVIITCQAWAQQNISSFLPKYLSDLGKPASYYGLMASIYMGGAALGNLSAGYLGERMEKRWILVGSLGVAAVPLGLIVLLAQSGWLVPTILWAGFCLGAAYTIAVVLGQRLIPGGMGLASGLILGFVFSSGALGVALTGVLADAWGFERVFIMTAGIAVVGAIASLLLRRQDERVELSSTDHGE